MVETIRAFLEQHGHGVDAVVPEELFEQQRDAELHRTTLSLPKDGPTYRDDRARDSVHVTDVRTVSRDGNADGVVVGHLEHFNPEYHPILHAVVDYPLWWWKNRITQYNPL